MKLPFAFCRLPVKFDIAHLQLEANKFKPEEWQIHPSGFAGNSAVRLITVNGEENDDFRGRMQATPHLERSPYIRQVLAQFGTVLSRSRLMKLAPGASVPEHTDINQHWFSRVRLHIPIYTDPAVTFTCGGQTVHMAEGEAWLFDNWRMHSVQNGSQNDRVHLVADTMGSAKFWDLVGRGQRSAFNRPLNSQVTVFPFNPEADVYPYCERHNDEIVMHPAEVELLVTDLLRDLKPEETVKPDHAKERLASLAITFMQEWRTLWSLFGNDREGWSQYREARDWALRELQRQSPLTTCASNGMKAIDVLYSRVLIHAFRPHDELGAEDLDRTISVGATEDQIRRSIEKRPALSPRSFSRPIFIVAAPRSGSSLLFETLARARGFATLGGEAHWLVENIVQLRPGTNDVDSNRLVESHVDDAVRKQIFDGLAGEVRGWNGEPCSNGSIRLLEKTPKNALRIPFFKSLFHDARFIFLWRDPRENIGSIIDAWQSGGWVTYPDLPGWGGPWSLLLPPGWQDLRGRPLEEIAAFQWKRTNETVLDDIAQLRRDDWTTVNYAEFIADPTSTIRRLTEFSQVEFDYELAESLCKPLPLSKHTLAPPDPEKWKKHSSEINRLLPSLEPLEQRLRALSAS